jgi:DNA polymerase-3 subunit epsilon
VAIDLEMTGLDPAIDRICEIALVRGHDGVIDDRWSTLVDPGVPVHADAHKLHGLGDAELAGAPTFADVADEVLARLDGAVRLAHHVALDEVFLDAALGRIGRALPAGTWIDTLQIARRSVLLPRHRLGDVCRAFGVPLHHAHRALQDATATFELFTRMLDVLDPDGRIDLLSLRALVDDLAPGSAFRDVQLRTLDEAFRARRPVRIEYLSRDDAGCVCLTVREVEIWKVSAPRIEGWCRLRGERRVFRLERMRRVEPSGDAYEIPEFKARI